MIVNTDLLTEGDRPAGLLELVRPRWKGLVVMARPQFGTSATQAACLFQALGKDRAEEFYRGLKANGVQIAPGNRDVARWVAQGSTPNGQRVAVGITDTDDALAEVRAGRPVKILYPDREGMGALFIPNALAIVKGCPNLDGARKLVDFLLSSDVEKRLAEAESCQVPLNPEVQVDLPAGIETPRTVKSMSVYFDRAAAMWEEVQKFILGEFARPG